MKSENTTLGVPLGHLLELPDTILLTTKEVSRLTRVAESTLRKWSCWRREGDLIPFVKRGGKNLYRPGDVRQWLGLTDRESA